MYISLRLGLFSRLHRALHHGILSYHSITEYQGIGYRYLPNKWNFTTLIDLTVKQLRVVPLTCFHFWSVSLANVTHDHFAQAGGNCGSGRIHNPTVWNSGTIAVLRQDQTPFPVRGIDISSGSLRTIAAGTHHGAVGLNVLAAKILCAPIPHFCQNGHQTASQVGHGIFHLRGNHRVYRPGDQILLFQFPKLVGQYSGGSGTDDFLQFIEPKGPICQMP